MYIISYTNIKVVKSYSDYESSYIVDCLDISALELKILHNFKHAPVCRLDQSCVSILSKAEIR